MDSLCEQLQINAECMLEGFGVDLIENDGCETLAQLMCQMIQDEFNRIEATNV